TWGKVDPDMLPDTVTCYLDSTVALPLLTAYALSRRAPRTPRRLMDRLPELTRKLEAAYQEVRDAREEGVSGSAASQKRAGKRFCEAALIGHDSNPFSIASWIARKSSTPTDRRISPSVIPWRFRSAGGSKRCEVVAGWLHVVVAWPSDGLNGIPPARRNR